MSRKPSSPDLLAWSLRACACGIYPDEAAAELLISHGTFLHRDDFAGHFISNGTHISDGTAMAAINWEAVTAALSDGELPCSGGERRILMLSCSLGAGIPVDLRDAVTGLDDLNIQRLLTAIRHASGKRPENSKYR